jgi:stage II sporulation protein AA (anti-sigma F factor antagonist)
MSQSGFKHLRVRREKEVLVVTIAVPFIRSTAFELVESLRQELFTAVADAAQPRVILDLSEIEYFGSAGIRPLLSLRHQIQEAGGKLVLCNLSPHVDEVLRTTRLIGPAEAPAAAFEVVPDAATALARLS